MSQPNPVAFSIFGFEVRWYGIFIAAALILAMFIALKRSAKYNISDDNIYDFFLLLIPSIIIGARLYYVIFEWEYYAQHPSEIIMIWHGGLAIHGGIIAGVLAGIIFCRIRKISFYALADTLIPALPLGQAIGRWGNFFNGEAYGEMTDLPWAITVNDPIYGLIRVHPTFLYESIWNLFVFLALLLFEKKWKKEDGELLFLYFILYSIGRFFIEGLRTDSLMFYGFKTAQLLSIVLIIFGSLGIYWLRRREKLFSKKQ